VSASLNTALPVVTSSSVTDDFDGATRLPSMAFGGFSGNLNGIGGGGPLSPSGGAGR